MALLAGTVSPVLGRADDTRITPVGFGPMVDDWAQVSFAIQTTMEKADAVRYRIIRHVGKKLWQRHPGLPMNTKVFTWTVETLWHRRINGGMALLGRGREGRILATGNEWSN